ncbi:chitin synthase chs-2-like [Onthophagus taurus]|uniref:chitin synthase chs-2-like n=1 Tax=Onthophagus taurus TaxID=166361 RepID=UPI0039BE8063
MTLIQNYESSNKTDQIDDKWDIFDEPPELSDESPDEEDEKWKTLERFTKLLIYIITFLMVLFGSVISKATLLFVTAQLSRKSKQYCKENVGSEGEFIVELPEEEIVAWMWILIFIYFVPQLATFLRSWRILLFKKWKMPGILEFVSVFLGESSSTIGNSILVFYILPRSDFVRGCLIMNCFCVIPAILSLSFNVTGKNQQISKFAYLHTLCVIIQGTGIILLTIFHNGPNIWFLPLAAVLISLGWWENYIRNINIYKSTHFKDMIISSKTFPNSRYFTYCIVSLWKCILFFGTMCLIELSQYGKIDHLFSSFKNAFDHHDIIIKNKNDDASNLVITNNYLTPIWVLTLSIIATYLTYIFGKFACKINIQRISYATPLHLSGVVTVLGILGLSIEYTNNNNCAYSSIIPSYLFFNDSINYEAQDIWLIFMGLLLLASFILVTFHIRAPQNESLASTEKLYVRPYYEPFFIDQDLAMNRRRNDDFDYRGDKETFSNDTENVEPMLYVCGTMWHETKEEMITFLKSIVYLDEDHCLRRIGKNYVKSINYYKLESHIVFDHAFTKTSQGNQQAQMNDFVKDLINSVKEVVAMVHKCNIKLKEPIKYVTPYGGKLEWVLPGKTKLIAHLKDNDKIRSKKRWSQVMYLYYILGHRIMGRNDLNNIQKELEAENTFILSVDGDIRFRPKAVHMLLEYMKRDKTLAAACGRVHPVGKGIFSWYQKFEYAISHWMYKASENVVGCILCCPGCFTIFRATAVMSIIKKLTTKSTKAVHFIKFDHGEDRWISTLLVLCGFKVGYVASSDAYTNCPEGFRELFNQRRRWIPSTTANILDLLSRTSLVTKVNQTVSILFMIYQYIFNIMTIITPSMIFWIVVNMCKSLFDISLYLSFVINLVVILIYIAVCGYVNNEKIQIQIALILCGIYTPLMCTFFVSGWFELLSTGFTSPWTLFFCIFLVELLLVTLCHPQEIYYLKYFPVFYAMIPTMHLILFIYSIFNMDKVSWGTREINKESIFEEVTEKSWINDNDLRHGSIGNISEEENVFWVKLLNKYLYPLDDAKNKSRMIDDLKDLREKVISSLIIVNGMFISVLFLLTSKNITISWPFNDDGENFELELFNTILVLATLLLLFIQLIAIFIHRFGTFAQIMSNTKLTLRKDNTQSNPVEIIKKIQRNQNTRHTKNFTTRRHEEIDLPKSNIYTDLEDAIIDQMGNDKNWFDNNDNLNCNRVERRTGDVNYGFIENV